MIGQSPICLKCKHFFKEKFGFTCEAFPEKIPDAIIDSVADHTVPYQGDHGIQFEPLEIGS